ncbi:unnamed protein product, partial [Polarella glacialis]
APTAASQTPLQVSSGGSSSSRRDVSSPQVPVSSRLRGSRKRVAEEAKEEPTPKIRRPKLGKALVGQAAAAGGELKAPQGGASTSPPTGIAAAPADATSATSAMPVQPPSSLEEPAPASNQLLQGVESDPSKAGGVAE